ncbi:MAG TPA: glycosyltransferase family 4 protein [Burkholderiales bacterium]|nr:glycosyltransferase family 4 protein [Burkholderiales bacterium]
MRVIFVTPTLFHGGAERHAIAVMNRMAERGHECHAVYVKNVGDLLDRVRLGDGGTVRCLDATCYFDRRALADFAEHISRVRPSVVVATNAYALMYSWLALRRSGVRAPLAVTFHTTLLPNAKHWLQMLYYRLFFWTADCLVFICEAQRRHWLRRGLFSRRNELIYNGVDTEAFSDRRSPEDREKVRSALGFSDADFVIGILALLRPEKKHLQLVEAVAALRKMGIPARALMIGDGVMRPAIEARARSLGLERDIVITGLQQEVRPYIVACDAVALCSDAVETFSLAALEAMALGRPVVHSHIGGAAEMIQPGENGFLFPVGDTEALVDRLARLSGRADRERMGRKARETVETRFSERAMVDRYERLLLDLCRTSLPAEEAVAH